MRKNERGIREVFNAQRKSEILRIVREAKSVTVAELSRRFRISESTIRRDLRELEERMLLTRTHGGAIANESADLELPFSMKELKYIEEKKKIARLAAQLVEDGDTIILDSGTTTLQIARLLRDRRIVVVTNSVKILYELSHSPNIELIVTGGAHRPQSLSLVGPLSLKVLSEVNADKLFLGANGIVEDKITTTSFPEAETKRKMVEVAKEVILVADHSKFGRVTLAQIVPVDSRIARIITDDKIERKYIQLFRRKGIDVLVAK
ncbi:MAG: DeoR/GlpR family DNA-binding transcription regulator [bacterium]